LKFRRPLILLGIAALFPLVVLSAVLGVLAIRQQQNGLRQEALDRVDRVAAGVDRELAAQLELLRALSRLPVLDSPADQTAFAESARRVRQDQPLWFVVSLSDIHATRLVDVPEPIGGVQGGKVIDVASHARAVEMRQPAIGRMLRGTRGRPAFAIRMPVIRDDRVTAILSAVIGPDAVRDVLVASGLPNGWIGAVVDADGRLVARTAGPSTLIGEPASEAVRQPSAQASRGMYEGRTLEGMPTVTAHRSLTNGGWSVHIGLDRGLYYAPLTRSLWLIVGGALLSFALLAIFVWLLVRELRAREREQAAMAEGQRLEALGRMTGGVAHDFNNILMIAMGSAEALKRRRANPDQVTRFADAILSAANRGQLLTRQLLAFARRSTQEPISFHLQERVGDLGGLLDRSTRGDIVTAVSIPNETWPIYADPNALEVALINLAVNARDAMPNGGRLSVQAMNVTLESGRDSETGLRGDYVALVVRDSGAGIPKEHLSRIFEPFYTTKPTGKGTGLGLSQVFGFAKQSNGTLTVTSKIGEGTTFTLYLPRSTQPPREPPARDPSIETRSGGRLLLVEDNHEVAQVTEAMLASAGYAITWANSGKAALDIIDKGEPVDIVLSDVVMEGGLSGLELAPLLRKRRPGLPIVLMTGYSEALAKSSSSGFPVLAKPFAQADAIQVLRAATHAARSSPSPSI
jgi:signal transduction histidine kinase/CheY-like chemotaxis protein